MYCKPLKKLNQLQAQVRKIQAAAVETKPAK
jgi:hypothetical protein